MPGLGLRLNSKGEWVFTLLCVYFMRRKFREFRDLVLKKRIDIFCRDKKPWRRGWKTYVANLSTKSLNLKCFIFSGGITSLYLTDLILKKQTI